MKVELGIFGSDAEMALEIIPETDFEKSFMKQAILSKKIVKNGINSNYLLMLECNINKNKLGE